MSDTRSESLRAFDEAQAALAATSTPDLLRKAYTLTHRLDGPWPPECMTVQQFRSHQRDLRAQRDMIDAEVLRRTGDL